MDELDASIRQGHYAKKQLLCRVQLIAWSHRARFRIGVQIARPFAGKSVLDYGCGDGTFLAMLRESPNPPRLAVGAELHDHLVRDCQDRLGRTGLEFVLVENLNGPQHRHAYDAVFCMEVLEHCLELEPILDAFDYLLAPQGKMVISVPVETGLPLIIKQLARQMAGWRGVGDYPGTTSYSLRELWASVFAGRRQHILRPIYEGAYDHKGFNWKVLRDALARRFVVETCFGSPLPYLPLQFASQVWFQLCRKY